MASRCGTPRNSNGKRATSKGGPTRSVTNFIGRCKSSFGLTDVVALTLDNASYEADYKAGELPRKARLDTEYSLCFRICLVYLVGQVMRRRRRNRVPPLHIVVEAGHRNFGDAERVFQEERQIWTYAGVPILRSLAKADKDECGALMIADFTAHSEYVVEKHEVDTGIPRNRATVGVPKGMTPSTHIQFTPRMLRRLRAEIVAKTTTVAQRLNSATGEI